MVTDAADDCEEEKRRITTVLTLLMMDDALFTNTADDYKEEKRRITAAMLRRLEVEEWDKERMKHFYYGGSITAAPRLQAVCVAHEI